MKTSLWQLPWEWKRHAWRRARRFWRDFWRRVCQRSPNLCRVLEAGRKAVFRFDPEALEAQIAALSLSAAIRLWFRALRVSGDLSEAHLLTSLLPYWAWALLFAAMGLSHVAALATSHLRWRALSAMAGVLAWSFVSVLMMLDGMTSPGTVLFPVIACSEAWVYLRLTTCCFTEDTASPASSDTDAVAGEDAS